MYKSIFFVSICIFIVSCSKVPQIKNFNSLTWKEDEFGCKGLRNKLSGILEEERQSLKGAQETDLIKLLGQPNSIQIMARKQKYFTYWINNPTYCGDSSSYKEVKIRISALNQVTEVLF